ncbi:uncharacterized protein Z519_06058 [Cladophialophora bantiana CBS 173.52]|uniref:Uncharacterized protein n=1 Tax=Cladophialophora bantiana (strain ATCC 10958 / CBS 173.52 / CDC B-1940 / NIH 8579) TaxID=1442370 RepID=A0A0D2HJK0_CLAB1|nr:uncharacterized protein Z519_06058 [Cladophialophora bantiana CBS 173.52]KIW93453.1 hypothetical protein Z519_06058 [Cladophialophora bantiana CBS 173.52]
MGWGLEKLQREHQIAIKNAGIGGRNQGAWRSRKNENYLVQERAKLEGAGAWNKGMEQDKGKNGQTKVVENIQYGIEQVRTEHNNPATQPATYVLRTPPVRSVCTWLFEERENSKLDIGIIQQVLSMALTCSNAGGQCEFLLQNSEL